jgi:PAS domain S-box-containing protein
MPTPPPSDDPLYSGELRARAELTLAAVLRALMVVLPILLVASIFGNSTRAESIALGVTLPYTAALIVLQRRGHFQLCIYAAVFGLIAFSAVIAALYGSVRSVGTLGQVAAITVGGLFLPRAALLSAVALSVASIGALIYAELAGWLPAPNYGVTAAHWVIYSVIIAAVAMVLSYMRLLLLDLVRRLRSELVERQKAEAGHSRSEAKYEAVFSSAPDPIVIARERDAVQVEANQAWFRITGYTREQAIGRSTLELGLWPDLAAREKVIAQLKSAGAVDNVPVRFRMAGGQMIEALLSGIRVTLDGEPCIVWSWRDMTEQLKQQRALAESEARFEKAFHASQEAIALTRLADGRVVSLNRRMAELYGAAPEELVGKTTVELDIWTREQRKQMVAALERERRILDQEVLFRNRRGEQRTCNYSAELLELDGELHAIGFLRDITEQRRAESARRQALERFQTVFDHSPESIAISRLSDGKLLAVNDAWIRVNGFSREEVIGRETPRIGIWRGNARQEFMSDLLEARQVSNRYLTFSRKDGAPRHSMVSATLTDLDGESCIIWMSRDITEQQRAEEELGRSRRLLETVIDALPMPIFAKDTSSNYIMLNRRMADFFGSSKEEILRRHTSHLPIPGATRTKSIEDDDWVFRNLRTLDQPDVFLEGSNGVQTNYHSTKIPLFDESGKLIGLLGINREIAEEKRAQEALRNSEHRYRSLFQAAMDCILVISPDGAIVDINQFGCRTLDYSREELIGGSFARILEETKLSRLLPRPALPHAERRSLRAEQEVRAKDGSLRAVEFTAGPLPDGNILVVARDVTERRRNETLLDNIAKGVSSQTGEDFFRSLVLALGADLPADMVFIGEVVGGGESVRTIACCIDGGLADNFEYPLRGSPCVLAMEKRGTVIHPERVAEHFPEDVGLARRGISGYAGTSLFDASGKAIGILVALMRKPIERKEFVVSMLEIFAARAAAEIARARADATVRELNISLERRVRERTMELETANRDLDSFGYSVSHDLRAPLGALNGFAHLLRAREAQQLSDDGVHLLRQIETNATRMTNLVEGLLEFSRLGRKPVTRVAVPMANLVGEVVDELGAATAGRRVDFRIGAGATPR